MIGVGIVFQLQFQPFYWRGVFHAAEDAYIGAREVARREKRAALLRPAGTALEAIRQIDKRVF